MLESNKIKKDAEATQFQELRVKYQNLYTHQGRTRDARQYAIH